MQLVFDEYFKIYPVKKRIVEGLYASGISIVNEKFYLNNIEIPLSSIATTLKVNRRTLYETIKFVNKNPVVKEIMENVSVLPDMVKKLAEYGITVSKGMGNLANTTLRVGTMGMINNHYIEKFLNSYFKISGKNIIIKESDIPQSTRLPDFLVDDVSLA